MASSSMSLQQALDEYRKVLTPEQKVKFEALTTNSTVTHTSVLEFTAQLDEINARQKRRCLSTRLWGVLQSVEQFAVVVDQFVSSNPGTAALVWGSIRLTFLVAANTGTYFEELSASMLELRNRCPRLEEYNTLFKDSIRVQKVLCEYYALVIAFCQKLVTVLQRPAPTSFTLAIWKPYNLDFGDFKNKLSGKYEEVIAEINLASEQAARVERERQARERSAMQKFRRNDKNDKADLMRQKLAERHQNLLEQLSTHRHLIPYRLAKRQRIGPTCSWLVDSDIFNEWKNGSTHGVLCCFGNLGCGKTVMASHVVDTLICDEALKGHRKAFFFCQAQNSASLIPRNILASYAKQLLKLEEVSTVTAEKITQIINEEKFDTEALESLVVDVSGNANLILLLDGLDECSTKNQATLLECFHRLVLASPNTKLFITSRPDLRPTMDRLIKDYSVICMDEGKVNQDAEDFVKNALAEKKEKGQLCVRDEVLETEITNALVTGTKGMMLWTALQLEEICRQRTVDDIRQTLKSLPDDLPKTYQRALHKMSTDKDLAKIIKQFRYMVASKRPMTLGELVEAIAVEEHQTSRQVDRYIYNAYVLISWSAGLVIEDEEEHTVQFVHPSVTEFLMGTAKEGSLNQFHIEHHTADRELGLACVTYLNFSDFQRQLTRVKKASQLQPEDIIRASLRSGLSSSVARSWTKIGQLWKPRSDKEFDLIRILEQGASMMDERALRKLQQNYPFLAYANENILFHSVSYSRQDASFYLKWKRIVEDLQSNSHLPWQPPNWSPSEGFVRFIVEHDHILLLEKLMSFDEKSCYEMEHLAKKLLHLGFRTTNSHSYSEEDPRVPVVASIWTIAISNRRARTLEWLVRFFKTNNMKNQVSLYLYWGACQVHYVAATDLLWAWVMLDLLEGGNVPACDVTEAIDTLRKRFEVAQWYYEPRNLPPPRARYGVQSLYPIFHEAPLSWAARTGKDDLVSELLATGAQILHQDDLGVTALHRSAQLGRVKAVELILEYGKSSSVESSVGDMNLLSRLVNIRSKQGETPLHFAAAEEQLEVIQTLLDAGADVNRVDEMGDSPLHGILRPDFEISSEIPDKLVSNGADVNMVNGDGKTPLMLVAAKVRGQEIICRLLEAGASVNLRDRRGRSALTIAAGIANNFEILQTLLKAGADVYDKDKHGESALSLAIKTGDKAMIMLLRDSILCRE